MKRTTLKSTRSGLALAGTAVACAALAFSLGAFSPAQANIAAADESNPTAVAGGDASQPHDALLGIQRSVTVNASDSVKVAPDMAELSVTISPQRETADEAKTAAAQGLSQLTDALAAQGIDPDDVVSSQVSVNARYDWSESVEKVVGYQASVGITVKELTLDQASAALSATVAQADTTVEGVRYYVSTYDETYQQALVAAMQAAQLKAQTLAQAAGAQLGYVLTVEEGRDSQAYRYSKSQGNEAVAYSSDGMAAAEAADTGVGDIALNPGEVEIEASVTVSYQLQ